MKKRESENQYSSDCDEKKTAEVSEQIMEAYNIGSIDREGSADEKDKDHMKGI